MHLSQVKTRFQNVPFKCNLHRYTEEKEAAEMMAAAKLEELDEKDAYKTPEELAPAEDAKDLNHLAISPEHVDSTKDDSAGLHKLMNPLARPIIRLESAWFQPLCLV